MKAEHPPVANLCYIMNATAATSCHMGTMPASQWAKVKSKVNTECICKRARVASLDQIL